MRRSALVALAALVLLVAPGSAGAYPTRVQAVADEFTLPERDDLAPHVRVVEEVGDGLVALGVPAERVVVTGIPIDPAFAAPLDRTACRAALGLDAVEASRLLLEESSIAATAMPGWGGPVAERHVRFVFSAEPVERLETIPERLAGGTLAAAAAKRG